MWQLTLLYLLLAVVAGIFALLLRGVAQDLAGITAGTLLALCAVSFIAGLLPGTPGRRAPR
jgi:hypothetical protein